MKYCNYKLKIKLEFCDFFIGAFFKESKNQKNTPNFYSSACKSSLAYDYKLKQTTFKRKNSNVWLKAIPLNHSLAKYLQKTNFPLWL